MLDVLREIFARVLKYSTPFGHAWNAVIFLFRLLPASTLGEEIFDDEQEEFECTTSQPACKQMCYNRFSPMSHHRLWALQILVISIPVLIFSFIAAQSSAKFTKYQDTIKEFDENESGLANGASSAASYANNAAYQKSNRKYEKAKRKLRHYKNKTHMNYEEGKSEDIIWTATIRRTYLVTCVIKLIMELMYIWHLYMLQTKQTNQTGFFNPEVWKIPERYNCAVGEERHHACSQDTDVPCFVSRSWEKRIFLYYYIIMSGGSIAMVVLDIIYVTVKVSIKKVRRNRERRQLQHQQFAANHSMDNFHRPAVDANHLGADAVSIKSFRSINQSRSKMAFQPPVPVTGRMSQNSGIGSHGSRVDLIKD